MKIMHEEADFLNSKLVKRIVLTIFLFALVGCAYFVFETVANESWVETILVLLVAVSLIFSFVYVVQDRMLTALAIFGSAMLIANLIGVTFVFGLKNPTMIMIFPTLVMISISLRKRPILISTIGSFCFVWMLVLYQLEVRGFYEGQEAPLNLRDETIVVSSALVFIVLMLHITAKYLIYSHTNLEKAKNQALQEKFNAEFANRAKSTFLAKMSHELRTPLNAIIGYGEMIAEESDGNINEDANRILISASNLTQLINSILELSKIETGILEISNELIDIPKLIDNISIILAPQLAKQGNELSLELSHKATLVSADQKKLKQILVNLISNANKFTTDGEINIKTSHHNDQIHISISDTGIGIPQDALNHIFDPFHQVENSLNRGFDGAGLGLAICKEFTTAMHGSIEVESRVDFGSTFTVSLPAEHDLTSEIPSQIERRWQIASPQL